MESLLPADKRLQQFYVGGRELDPVNVGFVVRFVTQRGKGSHGTLFYGSVFTIVRNPPFSWYVFQRPTMVFSRSPDSFFGNGS